MNLLEKIKSLELEASDFGFAWEKAEQIMAQIKSECDEIEEHLNSEIDKNKSGLEEEIGDLLHAVFSLCVYCQLEPTSTLEKATNKFERRLRSVQELAAKEGLTTLKKHSFNELMAFWNKAKQKVG